MDEKQKLLIGFDLCDDFSQISCYNYKTFEPVVIEVDNPIAQSDKPRSMETSELIPTVVYKNQNSAWLFGNEALSYSLNRGKKAPSSILSMIKKQGSVKINGKDHSGVDLLEAFFRRTLPLIRAYFPTEKIAKIVITSDDMDKRVVEGIYKALQRLDIDKDRAVVLSRSSSFLNYTLNMEGRIWLNDVGLFDFTQEGLEYYHLSINKREKPVTASVEKRSFVDILSFDMIDRDKESLKYALENIIDKVLYKQLISTIYFTGRGFEDNWAEDIIQDLSNRRRIFVGQNLYAKGACYTAKDLLEKEMRSVGELKDEKFLILSDETIKVTVGLNVFKDGKVIEHILVRAGTPWGEINEQVEVILKDIDEIEIISRNAMTEEVKNYKISLEDLVKRPNKMTRIKIMAKSTNNTKLIISAKDLGFGDIYKGSDKEWKVEVL